MHSASDNKGVTVVELLLVMAILGVIMAVLGAFFASQARTTSRTQASNEVEIKVRTAAEILTQDLQMAGSRIVFNGGTATYVQQLLTYCSPLDGTTTYCVLAPTPTSLTLYYATSLRPTPCRRVDYSLTDGNLMRSDVPCGDAPTLQAFASNITGLSVEFVCEDGTQSDDPADCYTAGSFPQQATVTVVGTSENVRENRTANVTLTTTMPNLRPVAVSQTPGQ